MTCFAPIAAAAVSATLAGGPVTFLKNDTILVATPDVVTGGILSKSDRTDTLTVNLVDITSLIGSLDRTDILTINLVDTVATIRADRTITDSLAIAAALDAVAGILSTSSRTDTLAIAAALDALDSVTVTLDRADAVTITYTDAGAILAGLELDDSLTITFNETVIDFFVRSDLTDTLVITLADVPAGVLASRTTADTLAILATLDQLNMVAVAKAGADPLSFIFNDWLDSNIHLFSAAQRAQAMVVPADDRATPQEPRKVTLTVGRDRRTIVIGRDGRKGEGSGV
jgi:hypothetical protein